MKHMISEHLENLKYHTHTTVINQKSKPTSDRVFVHIYFFSLAHTYTQTDTCIQACNYIM